MTAPRILVAGAGYVGQRLAQQLCEEEGAEVFVLRRSRGTPAPGITPIQADLTQPDTLAALPENIQRVAFCAAASRDRPDSYAQLFIHGQRNLLDFLAHRGDPVRRYVMMSTTGVYGDTQGEWVDETTPAVPTHAGPADILKGEALIQQGPFPATAVRFSGIYGPGRNRLIRAVRNGAAYYLPGDPVFLNQIHVHDVAAVIRHLLFSDEAAPLLLASDCEPARRGDVLSWIAGQLNAPPPTEDAQQAPQPRHGNKRCRNQRLLDTGFTFRYPTYREGYGDLLCEEDSND